MQLIPSLLPVLAVSGVAVGVYFPVSFSTSGNNQVSTNLQLELAVKDDIPTQESWTLDTKKLSEEGPILTCNEHNKHYEVYLSVYGEGAQEWKKDTVNDLLTFKVLDLKDEKRVVWGPGVRPDNKWTNWRIRFDDRGLVKLNIPDDGVSYKNNNYISVTCQERKIDKAVGGAGQEVTIAAEKDDKITNLLKLKVDTDKCVLGSAGVENKTECDISFVKESNLTWISGFFPKAIFQTTDDN